MTDNAERAAPCTVANLIKYLRQFNSDMVVYLDIEAAVEDGYAEDYVEQAYVSLSYALGKLEDGICKVDLYTSRACERGTWGCAVQHNDGSRDG